ncbi:STAS domain-containing protein [Thalassoroseus pseudoceratinae]|uniref:STAS domain-containing protein n=1 Tax=Thalassoroseus pseudoceratinae TaxID=2713176 RepID=UPI00141E6A2D|nr:STAS domain-containing protein [Thalassoroseus pseudoceratinae]
MQFQILSNDDQVVKLRASGKLSRDPRIAQNGVDDRDPLAFVCGDGVFKKKVLLDLAEIDHIDSTGVEWLLKCHSECEKNHGTLILHDLSPVASDLMQIMRMDLVLKLVGNSRQAEELAVRSAPSNGHSEPQNESSHGNGD